MSSLAMLRNITGRPMLILGLDKVPNERKHHVLP